MTVTIYHNPRCSKSRQTLALLQERGMAPTVVEYLNTPPNAETLQGILVQLGMAPRDLMRTQEDAYRAAQLDNAALSEEDLVNAMVNNPVLIERPIVIANGKAAIGRPPENILSIL